MTPELLKILAAIFTLVAGFSGAIAASNGKLWGKRAEGDPIPAWIDFMEALKYAAAGLAGVAALWALLA